MFTYPLYVVLYIPIILSHSSIYKHDNYIPLFLSVSYTNSIQIPHYTYDMSHGVIYITNGFNIMYIYIYYSIYILYLICIPKKNDLPWHISHDTSLRTTPSSLSFLDEVSLAGNVSFVDDDLDRYECPGAQGGLLGQDVSSVQTMDVLFPSVG